MNKKTNGIPKTFPKSKIPVSYLLEYFKAGLTKNDFRKSYPWIKENDVDNILNSLIKKHCGFDYSFL